MSIKPSGSLPLWATSGTKVEPGSGQKASGWTFGQIPPSSFENWRAGKVGEWLSYLSDLTSGVDITDLVIRMAQTSAAEGSIPLVVASSAEAGGTGNVWKPLMRFAAGSGRGVRIFSGSLSTTAFAIAVNATWTPGNPGTWTQELSSQGSTVLAMNGTGISFARKAAGTSPWASWGSGVSIDGGDVSAATLTLSGALTAPSLVTNSITSSGATVTVTDNLAVDGDLSTIGSGHSIDSGSTMSAAGNVTAGGDYRYSTPYLITKNISPAGALASGNYTYSVAGDQIEGTTDGPSKVAFAISIPSGATFTGCEIQVRKGALAVNSTVQLRKFVQSDWSATPAAPTASALVSPINVASGASVSLHTVTITGLSEVASNAFTRYVLSCDLTNDADEAVFGMRYSYSHVVLTTG